MLVKAIMFLLCCGGSAIIGAGLVGTNSAEILVGSLLLLIGLGIAVVLELNRDYF